MNNTFHLNVSRYSACNHVILKSFSLCISIIYTSLRFKTSEAKITTHDIDKISDEISLQVAKCIDFHYVVFKRQNKIFLRFI